MNTQALIAATIAIFPVLAQIAPNASLETVFTIGGQLGLGGVIIWMLKDMKEQREKAWSAHERLTASIEAQTKSIDRQARAMLVLSLQVKDQGAAAEAAKMMLDELDKSSGS